MAEGESNVRDAADPKPWLEQYTPEGWIDCALRELAVAEQAFAERQPPAAAAAMKRAAGMALNGALRVLPKASWGRSYVEHLKALADDNAVPKAVADSARELLEFAPQPGAMVVLRTKAKDDRLLEATRTVMAHAYAIVNGNVGR